MIQSSGFSLPASECGLWFILWSSAVSNDAGVLRDATTCRAKKQESIHAERDMPTLHKTSQFSSGRPSVLNAFTRGTLLSVKSRTHSANFTATRMFFVTLSEAFASSDLGIRTVWVAGRMLQLDNGLSIERVRVDVLSCLLLASFTTLLEMVAKKLQTLDIQRLFGNSVLLGHHSSR